MSLQLGANFPSRWLATPYSVRRQLLRDLSSVCLLLDPNMDFDEWEKSQQSVQDETVEQPSGASIAVSKPATPSTATVQQVADAPASNLEQRLRSQVDAMIERALDPLRTELKKWLLEQITQEVQAQRHS